METPEWHSGEGEFWTRGKGDLESSLVGGVGGGSSVIIY